MPASLADLESEAMKLPREERARLADRLLASVYSDPEVDEAWAVEVQRRLAAVEADAPPIAADSALARVRRTLA
jgi:putative addiction module component (TIGR02574 family)